MSEPGGRDRARSQHPSGDGLGVDTGDDDFADVARRSDGSVELLTDTAERGWSAALGGFWKDLVVGASN